jgi:hypothetical protein
MSYTLKGFALNAAYVNNTLGVVSTIGELSDISLTYSQNKGYYKNDSISADVVLVSFTSANAGVATVVTPTLRDRVLPILNTLYGMIGTQTALVAATVAQTLLTTYQATANSFNVGPIIQSLDQTTWAPSWVSWVDNSLTGSVIKIWFSDPAFQAQFDDGSVTVIPPITPLDDFFKLGSAVQAEVAAVTTMQFVTNINLARAGIPETTMLALEYDYVDPANSAHTVPTNWGLLLYGPAGNSVDAQKAAVITYILANSTHTQAEWTALFPEIFQTTEFILVPLFDQVALPDQVGGVGIYSTQTNVARANSVYQLQVAAYGSAQVNQYLNIMGHPYRSLQVLSCGSPTNRSSLFELKDVFPDIIDVHTMSPDFGRMSAATRAFLVLLDTMIQTAETMDPNSAIPSGLGLTRLTRGTNMYVALNVNNIDYLVLSKVSMLANNAAAAA